jgi:hypothetical protein
MNLNRIIGSLLVVTGIVGFFTIADDLRHVGEFIGIASILLSGILLVADSFQHRLARVLPLRWIGFGLLLGIILGAALDNMYWGETLGIIVGTFVGFALLRKNRSQSGHVP